MSTIGENIYRLRKKTGISQEELGYQLKVTRQAVSKWENGTMQPSTDNVLMLCSFFKVDFDYFFNDKNNDENKEITIIDERCITENTSTDFIQNNDVKRKYTALWIILIVLISVFTVISVIVGSIFLYLNFKIHDGFEAVKTADYNVVGILFFVLAFIFIISLITLIIYLKMKKRKIKKKFKL